MRDRLETLPEQRQLEPSHKPLYRLITSIGLQIPYQGVVDLNVHLMSRQVEKAIFFILKPTGTRTRPILGMNVLRSYQDLLFTEPTSSLFFRTAQARETSRSQRQNHTSVS